MTNRKLEIYTDGGCRGNGNLSNIGAFGVVVITGDQVRTYSEAKRNTTNNEMELTALVKAIALADKLIEQEIVDSAQIYSDSAYSLNGIQDWMWNWERNGWQKKGGEIKNLELFQDAFSLMTKDSAKNISLVKVKGHSGVEYNELADQILNEAMDNALKGEG